jgi:hypothetical protein
MAGGLKPPPEVRASWPRPNYINPERQGMKIILSTSIVLALTIITICARFWARHVILRKVGADDFLILFSLVKETPWWCWTMKAC